MSDSQNIPQDVPLPEPTLLSLASMLASQAMISVGVFPHPVDGSTTIRLHQGKHLIDTVALLDEKTKASQTDEEKKTFENIIHELRMLYVAAQNEQQRRENS
ncbi:MAG: DUF1844 domain-containing protein [Planctomycetaceae bacterium]|nr:DUF1844 domain-containing protein [Planctomycetaceae bacterium]